MAVTTYQKAQRSSYLKRIYNVKLISLKWWGVIIFLAPAITAASVGLNTAFGGEIPGMDKLNAIISNPILFLPLVLLSFMSGPFSEELGWRGFALDPLLERFGFVKASVILGFIWGIWHLPLYFMPETWHGKMGFQLAGFWSFIAANIGLSIIMSLVYIGTKQSIFSAMLMHLSFNFSTQLIAGTTGPGYSPSIELIRSLLIVAAGISICFYMARVRKSSRSDVSGIAV